MPQTPLSGQRWRAVSDMSIEPRSGEPLTIKAGDEVTGAPDNWPPKWLVDQELVVPIDEPDPVKPMAVPADENRGVK